MPFSLLVSDRHRLQTTIFATRITELARLDHCVTPAAGRLAQKTTEIRPKSRRNLPYSQSLPKGENRLRSRGRVPRPGRQHGVRGMPCLLPDLER
jgi:hypothetical protein